MLRSREMAASTQDIASRLESAIAARSANVGVIGLGYVGLPLVLEFHRAGFPVIGFDIDRKKVDALRAGTSYIAHIDGGRIRDAVKGGHFEATADFARLAEADAILICVPTPLTPQREPDMSYIERTADAIGAVIRPGQLVVLESTTYPGTTEEVVQPRLEKGGLRVERDIFLAFSPEREDPGNPDHSTRSIPKVVGGVGPESARLAEALYQGALDRVVRVSSARVAEAVKILENTYRAVNIALVNELKVTFDAMGIDVWEVIEAARTKPFGFAAFYPGPGLGGHCIPIDPFYLTWKAREYGLSTRFIELAGEVNIAMPGHVVRRVTAALNDDGKCLRAARLLILGVAYKRNIADVRESPALEIIEMLQKEGARVDYHDPHIPFLPKMRRHQIELSSVAIDGRLAEYDAAVVVTDHAGVDYQAVAAAVPLIVDTRNVYGGRPASKARIVKA
jgi:UDP-N-acetyl-D-glucosamine dehydrogenase